MKYLPRYLTATSSIVVRDCRQGRNIGEGKSESKSAQALDSATGLVTLHSQRSSLSLALPPGCDIPQTTSASSPPIHGEGS